MERARVNGVELAYEVSGTGVPVLLIGGTGMPAVGWQFSQSPALVAAGYEVVTFASRGVAPSEAPPSPYRVADLAADTAALIEHLAIGPCLIVGVSLGGFVAEELSRTRPELVRACVLIASAGGPTAYVRAKFTAERELFAAGWVPHSHDVVDMLTATLRFDTLQDDDEAVTGWLAMLTQAAAAWTSPDGRLGQLHAEWSWMLDEDRPAGWPEVRVPCLVIAFEHDLYLPPRVGREAAQAMPDGRFADVAGATHSGHFEHADRVNRLLIDFLQAQQARQQLPPEARVAPVQSQCLPPMRAAPSPPPGAPSSAPTESPAS